MKKAGLFLIVLLLFQWTTAQQVPQQNQDFYNYLMKKSKNQKTTANVLAIGGATLTVTGMLIFLANAAPDGNDQAIGAAGAAIGIGGLSMIASIPFYISAANKKQKARELLVGIGLEKNGRSQTLIKQPTYYPALHLKIRLP
jgi:hypothetical protein